MALIDKMRSMIAPKRDAELDNSADGIDYADNTSEQEYERNRSQNLRIVNNTRDEAKVRTRVSTSKSEPTTDNFEQSARTTYSEQVLGRVHTRGSKAATVSPREGIALEPASQYSVSESVSLVNLSDIRALQSKIHEDNAASAYSHGRDCSNGSNNTDGHTFDANMTAEFDKVISIDPLIDDGTPRRIQIISPRRFNDMSALAQALKTNKIVVLRIARLDHQLAVRLLDFAFGATAALSGHTQKNERNEFIFYLGSKITPDEQADLAEKGVSLI